LAIFGTSFTFIVVVPFTVLVWFAARWREISEIRERSNLPEKILALGIYAFNIARNFLGFSEGFQGIGLFDMLVAFIAVCIAFYGLRGLRRFILPTAYLVIMVVGYQLEFAITEVAFLENFLAHLITAILNALGIMASANNNLVTLFSRQGNMYYLLVDAPCTGIKGMLAYGSLAVLMILDVEAPCKRKLLWTAIGLAGTFLINILRLLSIFLAAYFLEIDTAMAIHTYLGYSLFIVWVMAFWTIALKYMQNSKQETL
ncbi:MAG: archaeosortase/exosortase family protein, partial [Candidatus Bathyarchaeia archaeon]